MNANNTLVFSKDSLINFLEKWNSIEQKYLYKNKEYDEKRLELIDNILSTLYIDANNSISQDKLHKVNKTVKQIYFDEESNTSERIVEEIFNKFIYQYVNIEGIDILFDSTYFDIEWQMHFGYNFEEYTSNYYRDHYIHQVRNMFEMIELLQKFGFEKYCEDWLLNKHTNKVTEYLMSLLKYDVKNMPHTRYEIYRKLVKYNEELNKDKEKINDAILKQLVHELIYSASIVSALLHDIGYPLSFAMQLDKSVIRFLPNSLKFIRYMDNIDYIESKLKDSLLVKTVGIEEIEKGIKKYDHGTLSAIIFLLYYHDNGKIYSLNKTEVAIIELSALIMYNHTLKYWNQQPKKSINNFDYVQNLFTKNPLSYLFRICDDIQEWDRVYFQNTEKSNYFICNSCRMPTIKRYDDKNISKNNLLYNPSEYICGCNSETAFYNLRKNLYRKTINVRCCDEVVIVADRSTTVNSIPKNKTIFFHFDLFSLLEVTKYNQEYARYRAEEFRKIKLMLENQNDLGNTYLDYFISSNPVEIKMGILIEYIKCFCGATHDITKLSNLILNNNSLNSTKYKFFEERLKVYLNIYKEICSFKIKNIGNKANIVQFVDNLAQSENIENRNFIELSKKALERFYNKYNYSYQNVIGSLSKDDCDEYKKINNKYLKLHCYDEYESHFTENYVQDAEYRQYLENKDTDNWNMYADLYMFYLMNQKINQCHRTKMYILSNLHKINDFLNDGLKIKDVQIDDSNIIILKNENKISESITNFINKTVEGISEYINDNYGLDDGEEDLDNSNTTDERIKEAAGVS